MNREQAIEEIAHQMIEGEMIDCYREINKEELERLCTYITLSNGDEKIGMAKFCLEGVVL